MLVDIRNLKTHFPIGMGQTVHAVDGVSLQIGARQIVGLVGESGSGKTTLGKTVVGLLPKTAGEVYFRGVKLPEHFTTTDYLAYSRQMQMIFQDPYSSLNPRMTVQEVIGEPLRLQPHGGRSNYRDLVAQWLGRVGLNPDDMSRYPHEFSGGQRQRIGIARALIAKPAFVVCDEPISALDVSVQAQVVNLLGELQQDLGLTLLFIAHDLSMVRYISDRMAVMYLGAVVEEGPSDDVYFRPKHPYTQLLISSNPEPDPRIEKARAHQPIQGEVPSPDQHQEGLPLRATLPKGDARMSRSNPDNAIA